mmetsp:Transcript_6135/g.11630  ORF Transcript_6135/g.11630 Transcript_6135/m.11630 type:complete len:474 (-) Transcript_6135:124-1545(-)
MAAKKGRKASKSKDLDVVGSNNALHGGDNVDLETMERMLNSDSDRNSSDENESNYLDDDDASSEDGEGIDIESEESESIIGESEDDGDSDDEDDPHEENEVEKIVMGGSEKCEMDLRNLIVFNTHQINHSALYSKKSDSSEEEVSITVNGIKLANEEYLLEKAMEGCSQLLSGLWKLETEKTDAGPLATLPSYFETVTPRALPPPPLKAETKWEKFAKERGIAPKEKRSQKVWDEATGEWAYRTGYQKASSANDPLSWPIMEVKKNDDPYEDPWQKARDAKKDRIDKNAMNRMKNAEMVGNLDRGTTRRIMKAKKNDREQGRMGGSLDMKNFSNVPAGVPIDMTDKQRGKEKTKLALVASQISTASMGKFDQMREGEPERKKATSGLKKRKFESGTLRDAVKSEANKSLKVLENVIAGGGRDKDLAIRRGDHARGETGHDYDFDDGLGPSKFKKKKGRAGIGKMKKVTKKMAK